MKIVRRGRLRIVPMRRVLCHRRFVAPYYGFLFCDRRDGHGGKCRSHPLGWRVGAK